jgi:pseudouridine-5'-phosphate glycosidase
MNYRTYFDMTREVKQAIAEAKPIVALESTIISHGMPYPQNLETSIKCERIIREHGAVPATTAVINGRIKVGLTDEELEHIASAKDVLKISRRDIGHAIANGRDGATTVAAAMIFADLAGIRIFATGGIGGVHRGAQKTFDISADLQELARTDVCVVCAGAKSILDLHLTMEYLETMGVPVFGFETDCLPAFYTRTSDIKLDFRVDSAEDVACAMKAKWDFDIRGGGVVCVPIPEQCAQKKEVIDLLIEEAVHAAEEQGISGKELTPFILQRIADHTAGDSLKSNMELVWNNCAVAADIAVAYSSLVNA